MKETISISCLAIFLATQQGFTRDFGYFPVKNGPRSERISARSRNGKVEVEEKKEEKLIPEGFDFLAEKLPCKKH